MKDCIIIGGGLIGMLIARALHRRGYEVTVTERGPFGREASGRAAASSRRCTPGVMPTQLIGWQWSGRRCIPNWRMN